jgi:hypothetical protein
MAILEEPEERLPGNFPQVQDAVADEPGPMVPGGADHGFKGFGDVREAWQDGGEQDPDL